MSELTTEEKQKRLKQLAFTWMVSNIAEDAYSFADAENGYVPPEWVQDNAVFDAVSDFVMGELVVKVTEYMATEWPEMFNEVSFSGHGDVDIPQADDPEFWGYNATED